MSLTYDSLTMNVKNVLWPFELVMSSSQIVVENDKPWKLRICQVKKENYFSSIPRSVWTVAGACFSHPEMKRCREINWSSCQRFASVSSVESSGRVIVCQSDNGSSSTCLSEVLVGGGYEGERRVVSCNFPFSCKIQQFAVRNRWRCPAKCASPIMTLQDRSYKLCHTVLFHRHINTNCFQRERRRCTLKGLRKFF